MEKLSSLTPLPHEDANITTNNTTDISHLYSEAGYDDLDDLSSLRASGVASSILSGADYGFVSRSEGCKFDDLVGGVGGENDGGQDILFDDYGPPSNILTLGLQQFGRNLDAIRGEYRDEIDISEF